MSTLRARLNPTVIVAGLLVAVLAVAPMALSSLYLFRGGSLMVLILYAGAYYLVAGETGLLSLGHAAFYGAGAYAAAVLYDQGLPFFVAMPFAALVGAVLALAIGFVSLRSIGIYFAMLTLSLGQVVYLFVFRMPALGGQDGIPGIVIPTVRLGGGVVLDLSSVTGLYLLALGTAALGLAALGYLSRSSFGHMVRAIREDDVRSAALGANVRGYQLAALCISGAFAGLAGSLVGPLEAFVSPDIMHWTESALPLIVLLLGGMRSLWGAVVGAAAFEVLHVLTSASDLWMGVILLIIVLLLPEGLLGIGQRLRDLLGLRKSPAPGETNQKLKPSSSPSSSPVEEQP